MKVLNSILNYEPEVSSKFSALIIKDMVNHHTNELIDITHKYIKSAIKLSLLLGSMIAIVLAISCIEGMGSSTVS